MENNKSPSLAGKTIVMTGATSGFGGEAAHQLANQGARLIIIARDKARGDKILNSLFPSKGKPHRLVLGDLSLLCETRGCANEIAQTESTIDVLINNAGAMFRQRELTAEGFEKTFATNHLSYFALTLGLQKQLANTPGSRVVNTASFTHRTARYHSDDLQFKKNYSANRAYSGSKLLNILFTRELGRRWKSQGTTVNCFTPGVVATDFGKGQLGPLEPLLRFIVKPFAQSFEKAADTMIYLASSPDVSGITGEYFVKRRAEKTSTDASNDAFALDLWNQSLALVGLDK